MALIFDSGGENRVNSGESSQKCQRRIAKRQFNVVGSIVIASYRSYSSATPKTAWPLGQNTKQAGTKGSTNTTKIGTIPEEYIYISGGGSGTKYHLKSCRWAGIEITLAEAKRRGLTPCKVCKPPR